MRAEFEPCRICGNNKIPKDKLAKHMRVVHNEAW